MSVTVREREKLAASIKIRCNSKYKLGIGKRKKKCCSFN